MNSTLFLTKLCKMEKTRCLVCWNDKDTIKVSVCGCKCNYYCKECFHNYIMHHKGLYGCPTCKKEFVPLMSINRTYNLWNWLVSNIIAFADRLFVFLSWIYLFLSLKDFIFNIYIYHDYRMSDSNKYIIDTIFPDTLDYYEKYKLTFGIDLLLKNICWNLLFVLSYMYILLIRNKILGITISYYYVPLTQYKTMYSMTDMDIIGYGDREREI